MNDGPLGAGREIRDLEIAMALVDVARAAQEMRKTTNVTDVNCELFAALERWEILTGQNTKPSEGVHEP